LFKRSEFIETVTTTFTLFGKVVSWLNSKDLLEVSLGVKELFATKMLQGLLSLLYLFASGKVCDLS